MKAELLNLAFLTAIVFVVSVIIGMLYYFKMKSRTTVKNQCPCCHQNYGQRIQTPFVYDAFRTIL